MLSKISPSKGSGSAEVYGFYDDDTGSIQYVVVDPDTKKAALIDIVMTFNQQSASIDTDSVDHILNFVETQKLDVEWILDTHPHADHLMASSYLKNKTGAPNGIGEKVAEIADLWRNYYNLPDAFDVESDFDHLFADGDEFRVGSLPVKVILSPGHTLGSITYIVGEDSAFVHDTFMQPDAGTSRADFPGGSSPELYDTLQTILSLPDQTRLFIGHDYGTAHRTQPMWESTVAQQRNHNAHIGGGVQKMHYCKIRDTRDRSLELPDRMLHVLQMNLRAGGHPPHESDGNPYLKIPLNRFGGKK